MKSNHNCVGLLVLSALCLVGIGILTALGKPVPEIYSWAAAGALGGLLGLTPPGTVGAAIGALPGIVEPTPDEAGAEVEPVKRESATELAARKLIEAHTPDVIEALLPSLVPNVAAEVRRGLKRLGIRL